jgi:hypothetical protein
MNLVEIHPQLSENRHPVDSALVGAGSFGPYILPLPTSSKFEKIVEPPDNKKY